MISEMTKWQNEQDAKREQMLRELMSDLNALVRSGDMTSLQANELF